MIPVNLNSVILTVQMLSVEMELSILQPVKPVMIPANLNPVIQTVRAFCVVMD